MRAKRILILVVALVAAAVLQSTLTSRPILLDARVDLVLLLVVTYSVARGMAEGLLGGLVGGFAVNLLSAVPFGAATLGMGLIGLLTGLGEANVYRANILIPLVAVFMATVFYHSFLMLALQAAGWTVDWTSTLALQTIPGAVLNSVLAPVVFYFVRRLAFPGENEERYKW